MAPKQIGSDKATDPRAVRELKDWGRAVNRELGASIDRSGNHSGSGSMPSRAVDWDHSDGFRAYFKHREQYSTASKLVVAAGIVYFPNSSVTAASVEITLPGSGNLFVYVDISVAGTPSATITSNASAPTLFHATTGTVTNYRIILGKLTEIHTGTWSWTAYHEGDIHLPQSRLNLFPVTVTQTGGSAGDATTQCSFTYTVTSILGESLLTSAMVGWARPALGKMIAATKGTAYINASGVVVLWQVDEVFDVAACT